jgi:hypothetical protein
MNLVQSTKLCRFCGKAIPNNNHYIKMENRQTCGDGDCQRALAKLWATALLFLLTFDCSLYR